VRRYLAVGGAGSLEAAPGLCVLDAPGFPEACRAEAEAGAVFLMQVKAEETLNWRFLSPSALFVPAERIGVFRRGTDQRLSTEAGSSIS
jgi:putative NADH-flavin reductase